MYCDADFIYGLSKRCQWRRVHNRDAALCSVVGGDGGDAAARPHGSGSLRAPGLVRRLHRRCAARDASSGSPSNHHGRPSSTTTASRTPLRQPVEPASRTRRRSATGDGRPSAVRWHATSSPRRRSVNLASNTRYCRNK